MNQQSIDSRRVALADMDETVITEKSMLRFCQFVQNSKSDACLEHSISKTLKLLSQPSTRTRAEANKIFYEAFRGFDAKALERLGHQWFQSESALPSFYNSRVVDVLLNHLSEGCEVWLVSGSFAACVAPVAAALGLTGYVCTEQEVDLHGRFTGQIGQPCIGRGKAIALSQKVFSDYGQSDTALEVWGYADHHTDIPMLSLADHAVCVNPTPELAGVAASLNWGIWSTETAESARRSS